jgi:methyltransferase (TIGR00027 family)
MSDCFSFGGKPMFDPTGEIGFGFDGFSCYHAARAHFITINMGNWLKNTQGDKQVISMGAGVETRVYWDKQLEGLQKYIEVDTKEVFADKEKVLSKHADLKSLCPLERVAMDFSKESTKDLPNHGVNAALLTCWVLEGLIMYLGADDNTKLLNELSDLSIDGSYLILNF